MQRIGGILIHKAQREAAERAERAAQEIIEREKAHYQAPRGYRAINEGAIDDADDSDNDEEEDDDGFAEVAQAVNGNDQAAPQD